MKPAGDAPKKDEEFSKNLLTSFDKSSKLLTVARRKAITPSAATVERKTVMAQKFVQSENFNFTVEAVPSFMQLPDGRFVKDGFTLNRRTDNFAVLGKVTDRYGLVQNPDLIGAAEDAFSRFGLTDFTRKICVVGEGEKLYAVYDFRSRIKRLNVGDEVGLRLTVQNSFDGKLRASFVAGIMRLVCKNGAALLDREVGMTQKHGSQVSVAFIQTALEQAVEAWDKSTLVFDRLASVSITQAQGVNILTRLAAQNVLSGKLREAIETVWANPTYKEDSARNLFNLYNAATQHLTHEVEGERFELANRVSVEVLKALNRASRKPEALAALMAPPTSAVVESELA